MQQSPSAPWIKGLPGKTLVYQMLIVIAQLLEIFSQNHFYGWGAHPSSFTCCQGHVLREAAVNHICRLVPAIKENMVYWDLHPPKEVLNVINIWMSHCGCSNGRLFPVQDPGKRIWNRRQRSKHKTRTGELVGCEVEGMVGMPGIPVNRRSETGASETGDRYSELRVTIVKTDYNKKESLSFLWFEYIVFLFRNWWLRKVYRVYYHQISTDFQASTDIDCPAGVGISAAALPYVAFCKSLNLSAAQWL